MGQTCVDLFFRHYLSPLPWQQQKQQTEIVRRRRRKRQRQQQGGLLNRNSTPLNLPHNDNDDDQLRVVRSLRQAMVLVCHSKDSGRLVGLLRQDLGLASLFEKEKEENEEKLPPVNNNSERKEEDSGPTTDEWLDTSLVEAVEWVSFFWSQFLSLHDVICCAACNPKTTRIGKKNETYYDCCCNVLQFLAGLPKACPKLIMELAVKLYPASWLSTVHPLPLHIATMTPPLIPRRARVVESRNSPRREDDEDDDDDDDEQVNQDGNYEQGCCTNNNDYSTVLQLLVDACPQAAQIKTCSHNNQYPLHVAIAMGQSWESVLPLWKAFPDALWTWDHPEGLPLVALAAMTVPPGSSVVSTKRPMSSLDNVVMIQKWKCGDPQLMAIWSFLSIRDKQRIREQVQQQWECQQLNTIFQILSRYPSALSH